MKIRKCFAFILVSVLLLSASCASAEKVYFPNFLQRYTKTVCRLEKEGYPMDIFYGGNTKGSTSMGELAIGFSCGTMCINKETGEITYIWMPLKDATMNEMDISINRWKITAMISVLEYTDKDDYMLDIEYEFGFGKYKNVYEQAKVDYAQVIRPSEDVFASAKENREALVCSGKNYNYYIVYSSRPNEEMYSIIAELK